MLFWNSSLAMRCRFASWRATSSPPCSDARGNPPAPSPAAASAPAPPAPPPATAPSGPGSAPAFFLEPLPHHRHEQVRQPHQRHMVVPIDPRPRLVLRHPKVTLAVLKVPVSRISYTDPEHVLLISRGCYPTFRTTSMRVLLGCDSRYAARLTNSTSCASALS